MARGIWRSGAFLDLRWHDAALFEKPPLIFWVVSGMGGLLGFNDLAVRLPGALAGLMTVLVAGALCRALGGRKLSFRLAAVFLLCSYTFIFHSRRVLADPLFVLAMYGFVVLWVRASVAAPSPDRRWGSMESVCAGLCLGICVMTKWVFVVLPLLAVFAWHLVERRKVSRRVFAWVSGVSLAVALPWHVHQSLLHGENFWQVYAGYHVLERATRSLVSPTSWAFYFELLAATDPGFIGVALLGLVGSFFAWKSGEKGGASAWAMAAFCFLPLQLSSTKMPHYILAVVPAVAVGAALGWGWLLARFRSPVASAGLAMILIAAWLGGPLSHILDPDYSPTIKTACAKPASGEHPVILMNTYSPAATWYCDQPVTMHTDDARFFEVQQSIDMMARSGAVKLLETRQFVDLVLDNPGSPVVTRRGHGARLLQLLPRPHSRREHLSQRDADLLHPQTKPANPQR